MCVVQGVVRRALVAVVMVGATFLAGGVAQAWSNGVNGPDTFGTHDWVLRAALGKVGDEVPWVCVRAALRATDDSDTVDGVAYMSSPWWHVYDEWGASTYGDAPSAIAHWYERARRQRRADAPCEASRSLGIVAHLLADVAQPMHTDGWFAAEDTIHGDFEAGVDQRCTTFAGCRYTFRYDGPDPTDPRARALAVARHAHPWYEDLVTTFHRRGYTGGVDAITRRQLNRAANAVADLLTSF
jgi:hypothetical protein